MKGICMTSLPVICFLWLLGFLLESAYGYPGERHNLQKRIDPPFLNLLLLDIYKPGRIEATERPGCQFVGWKSINVVFYYKNLNQDDAILVETSAGIILCIIQREMVEHVEEQLKEPGSSSSLFSDEFLEIDEDLDEDTGEFHGKIGYLTSAKTDAIIYIDGWTPQECSAFEIFAIQIWVGLINRKRKGKENHPVRFPRAVMNFYIALSEYLNHPPIEPKVYGFVERTDKNPPQGIRAAPSWACAVWQKVPASTESPIRTSAMVYLGRTGTEKLNVGFKINPVLTLELSDGYVISETSVESTNPYKELAFPKASISYDDRYTAITRELLESEAS